MTYNDIFESFYLKIDDSTFFSRDKETAYDMMRNWLHDAVALPYVKNIFSSIILNDETLTIKYTMKNPDNDDSDRDFVIKILSLGMVVSWYNPKIETMSNIATVIGGKEEKRLQSNYKQAMERQAELEKKINKMIRDRNYINNSYLKNNGR